MSEASILAHLLGLKSKMYAMMEDHFGIKTQPKITNRFPDQFATVNEPAVFETAVALYNEYSNHMKMIGAK